MDSYIILSEKEWHLDLFSKLKSKFHHNWTLINKKEDFTISNLQKINPSKIFIPHWSYIIPSAIYDNYECVVFHMTDLPYGRGGSPLQNLIVRGHTTTKLSALRVSEGIDAGDIYLKKDLDLSGSATEIFIRANHIMFDMIVEILNENLVPSPQSGKIVFFNRRTKDMSNIAHLSLKEEIYNYIRMLDAKGYPYAYIESDHFKFEFTNAQLNEEGVIANVRITKK